MSELREGEALELKERWTDRALEDLAAFANTSGGRLILGVRDDGAVIGVDASDRELQRIANVVTSRLGITPSVRAAKMQGRSVIEVEVRPARGLVPCKGRYLRRVGSTNRDFAPDELARHVVRIAGQTWDGLPSPWGTDEVDREAVARFVEVARERLPNADAAKPERLLANLGLLREGRITNGCALLFGRRPQRLFPGARVRIGVFRGPDEVVDSHECEGNLFEQLDAAMERFRRVLRVRFEVEVDAPTLEGLRRKDIWEYPLEAIREAVVNALVHRDYTIAADVQVRVYDDRLVVWNPGGLPEGIRIEQLKEPDHPSIPRNPHLARAFYFAGLIERWGTGTTRMVRLCAEQGLPEPEFDERSGNLQVVFQRDPYTPRRLRQLGLNERQVRAVLYVKAHGRMTNQDYQGICGVSKPTATRDLEGLTRVGILERRGTTGRGTYYVLRAHKGLQGLTKGSQRAPRGQEGATRRSRSPDADEDA